MTHLLHVELNQAGSAECVPTVDHDPGQVLPQVVLSLAEWTFLGVKQIVDELVDVCVLMLFLFLRLLEEIFSWILKLLHFKIY